MGTYLWPRDRVLLHESLKEINLDNLYKSKTKIYLKQFHSVLLKDRNQFCPELFLVIRMVSMHIKYLNLQTRKGKANI